MDLQVKRLLPLAALLLLALAAPHQMPVLGTGTTPPTPTPTPNPLPTIAQAIKSATAATCGSAATQALTTQPAAGDLIVVYVIASTTGTLGAPAGFSPEDAQNNSFHYAEWYKYSTGSDGTSWTYTSTVNNGPCVSIVVDVANPNATTPFDKHGVNLSTLNASAGPFTTSSLTPTVTGDLPIAMLDTGSSSQTVSSFLPVTLTLGTNQAQYTTRLYYDANLASLSAYSASMTMTGNNGFAHQVEVLDLIAPIGPAPTASPSPTPGPGFYSYHGCQVYSGNFAAADPIANANISAASVDTNSAAVIAATSGSITFSSSLAANLEIVNLANNTTGLFTVQINGGHNPPITQGNNPPNYGGAGAQVPWDASFKFEGTTQGPCSGDCHWTTLNTDTCVVYEGGTGTFVSGNTFKSYNGLIDSLGLTYDQQMLNKSDNWSVAGIPGLGWTDYGEDFALSAIPHPIQVILPVATVMNGTCANYSPCVGGDGSCAGGAAACFERGDILRLKAGFTCPVDAKAALVCNQLKTYGAIVSDTGSTPNFRYGLDTNGTDDTDAAIGTMQHGFSLSSNFDIISRNTIVP